MRIFFLILCATLSSSASYADILAVVINPRDLPFNLSPDKFDNSPDKFDNSSDKFDNSPDKFGNSPDNFDNSPDNFENRVGGGRNVLLDGGEVIGYYVFSDDGVLNFYNYDSRRVAYLPAGDHTQSVFLEDGWCGTLARIQGRVTLGLTQSCLYRFLLDD